MNITIREPGSALTHFIAMLLALCAAVPLLVRAAVHSGVKSLTAMTVFMISMVLLYAASTIYHSVNCSGRVLRIFRKMDHMMIFILIAGTYTPVCLLTLPKPSGLMLLAAVWEIGFHGFQRLDRPRCRSLGNRAGRNFYQRLLDHLSKMVFLCFVYRNGLELPVRSGTAVFPASASRLFMAARRRTDLYCRRHYLRAQAAAV